MAVIDTATRRGGGAGGEVSQVDTAAAFRIPDLPRWGPMRRRYLLRAGAIATAVAALGLFLIFVVGGPYATAAGLSLIVPGGGFLYDAWPLLFVITWAFMFFAWNLWVGFGAGSFPLFVYLIALAASIGLAQGPRLVVAADTAWEWAIPVVLAGAAVYTIRHLIRAEIGYRRGLKQRAERNAYLTSVPQEVKEAVIQSFTGERPAGRESVIVTDRLPAKGSMAASKERGVTDADAALAKWLLRLAMQPIDKFEGWDWGPGPFQDSALRYQISVAVGPALAHFQANYVPAYPSLYGQAQRNVIEKAQHRDAWGYWYIENLVGNLKLNPDPIAGGYLDNIMFGGFLATHLAYYEASTHDHRYDKPGSIRFVWRDGRVFAYSFTDIVEYCSRCLQQSDFTLWPCEPNQVYMVCNQSGGMGVVAYDALHGTDYWGRVQGKYRKSLDEEFMNHNGDYLGHFNTRLGMNVGGLTWNDGTSPAFMNGNDAIVSLGRAMTPEVAARLFLVGRHHEMWEKLPIEDGVLRLPPPPKPQEKKGLFDLAYYRSKVPSPHHLISGVWVDPTHDSGYEPSNAMRYAGIAQLASLYGNEEVATAAIRGLDEECFLGMEAPRPYNDRLMTLTTISTARWSAPYKQDDFLHGRIPRYDGPILAQAPYPDVLVTWAKGRDGVLELMVEPTQGSGEFLLKFERLLPEREYVVEGDGARFRTNHRGLGEATVALTERTFLTVRPV